MTAIDPKDLPPWEEPGRALPMPDEARFLHDWSVSYDRQTELARLLTEAPKPLLPGTPAPTNGHGPAQNGNGQSAPAEPAVNIPLDWEAEFQHDYSIVDWLPGKLCEKGQQVAFVGEGKVGKSLFWFEWAWRAVTGQQFLYPVECEPLTVVYCDRENSRRDLVMRAKALGAEAGSLVKFVYYSFPQLPALDLHGSEVLELVDRAGGDVVILDTVSRFVAGKENDAETWLGLYRRVHARLKAAGKTGIRLDHLGKDSEKGARGSSAKDQDVDVVWEMSARSDDERPDGSVSTEMRLTRTHTRTGIGPSVIDLIRRGTKDLDTDLWVPGSTSHRLAEQPHAVGPVAARVQEIIAVFDAAGIDPMFGRLRLMTANADHRLDVRAGKKIWEEVAKTRKDAELRRRAALRGPLPGVEQQELFRPDMEGPEQDV